MQPRSGTSQRRRLAPIGSLFWVVFAALLLLFGPTFADFFVLFYGTFRALLVLFCGVFKALFVTFAALQLLLIPAVLAVPDYGCP